MVQSTITTEMLSTIQALIYAQTLLVQISTPILLVCGNLGEILSIIIFAQSSFRKNSCAIYFLAASCARLLFINSLILFNGLSFGYGLDPSDRSLVLCKIKLYLSYVGSILSSSLVVLACVDRLILSSPKIKYRFWTRPWVAYRSVAVVSIFWMVVSIHAFFGSTIYSGSHYSYCYIQEGSYRVFITVYSISFIYLLPTTLMTILGLVTVINVRQAHRRVRSTLGGGYMQRKDRYLLRMLLFQVLVNVVFTIPLAIHQIYGLVSAHWRKDALSQAWDSFFIALGLMMFYIPNCGAFYIYTLTSSIFREELQRIAVRCLRRWLQRRQTPITTLAMAAIRTQKH